MCFYVTVYKLFPWLVKTLSRDIDHNWMINKSHAAVEVTEIIAMMHGHMTVHHCK